jgi:Methyltransferase domain
MGLDAIEGDTTYGATFFAGIEEGSRRSAEAVVPLLLDLFSPRSVVDVGGGGGHWAAACLARGVRDVLAVDGPWVPEAARATSPDRFLEHDLSSPLVLDRTFDLALCLEAAEHLPASAAPELVRALTAAAPVVAFSAASPGQGGDGHINEQPASYWARLFADRDYVCFSDLRRRIWTNEAVEVWYRQNLLCFVRRSELARWGAELTTPIEQHDPLIDVAHPAFLARHKARADGLEAYAHRLKTHVHRLEADAGRLQQELGHLRRELGPLQAELDKIRNSPAWRALRLAAGPIRRLRRYAISPREVNSAP